MHVVRIKSRHTDKQGRERQYESRLLRRTYRDGAKIQNETLANLSKLPDRVVDAVEATLKGEALVPAGQAAASIARSLPHGHVAAVYAMARTLGLQAHRGGHPAHPAQVDKNRRQAQPENAGQRRSRHPNHP